MARTHAYGIADLFSLVARLLSPFVDPLRTEFAVKAIDRLRPQPQPEPTPDPVAEPDQAVADPCVAISATHPLAVDFAPSDAGIPATAGIAVEWTQVQSTGIPADPLFVAVGEGRGRRYRLDGGGTPGPRFKRVVLPNGRQTYKLAN